MQVSLMHDRQFRLQGTQDGESSLELGPWPGGHALVHVIFPEVLSR
jgi:hypothetical protein